MKNIKLYTEEQVKDIVKRVFWQDIYEGDTEESLIAELTPIELPSDEEIIDNAPDDTLPLVEFIAGAKWVIEQIKQQNNEK